MKIGISYKLKRREEILLRDKVEESGHEPIMVHEEETKFPKNYDLDVVLIRNTSYFNSLYISKLFESQGIPTINSFETILESGDKIFSTLKMEGNSKLPDWNVSFDEETAVDASEDLGYPMVMKPVFGSWGRMVSKVNDRNAAEAIVGHRKWMKNPLYSIYYNQDYVEKPDRDIRSYVIDGEYITAIYRENSDHWITNTARGGEATKCEDEEVKEASLEAWGAFGEGALAIDLFESDEGMIVNEVNPNMEFKNSQRVTGVDIAQKLVDYAIKEGKE